MFHFRLNWWRVFSFFSFICIKIGLKIESLQNKLFPPNSLHCLPRLPHKLPIREIDKYRPPVGKTYVLLFGRAQVGASYARQAGEAGSGQASRSAQLLEQGKMPQEGWRDRLPRILFGPWLWDWLFREIEFLLAQLSQMDSNNFPGNCGVGEREARVYSSLVARFCLFAIFFDFCEFDCL